MPTAQALITPALFDFLRDLAEHNERPWFQENKKRYERDVRGVMVQFMEALEPRLERISKHVAVDPRPAGGSMMRIHRDIRFSRDKSPYKTNVGLHFSLAAERDVHVPGFYLHLQPDECFAAAGCWHPDPATLSKIRDAIAARPKEWKAVRDTGLSIQGESLKRAPAGYDAAHEWIEDIKRKDVCTSEPLTEQQVCSGRFLDDYVAACERMAPLMRFLAKALDADW